MKGLVESKINESLDQALAAPDTPPV